MQKWERFFPNPDYMNIPSFSRSVSRGSAVGWFLVLLLVCGAGAGYYLYQDNLAKRKAAQELTAERKLKEKKAREAAEKQRIKREREIREKKEKERLAAQKAYEEAQEEKARQAAEAARKLQEQAEREEREKRRREELERREREEEARRQEEDIPVEEEPEPEGRFPQPVKNRMPELSVYSIPCRDDIQTEKDKPLETWSWDKAEKWRVWRDSPRVLLRGKRERRRTHAGASGKMPGMEGCQTCLAEGVPGGEGFSRRSGEWGPDGQADGGDRFQYWRLA